MITPVSLLFIPGTNASPIWTFIALVLFSDVDTRALAYVTIDINRRVMIWYGFINILNTLTQLNEQLSICLLNEVGDGRSFRFEKRQLCSISTYWLSFILWCFICPRGPILRISWLWRFSIIRSRICCAIDSPCTITIHYLINSKWVQRLTIARAEHENTNDFRSDGCQDSSLESTNSRCEIASLWQMSCPLRERETVELWCGCSLTRSPL